MFENLTDRLSRTVQQLRGKGRLTEDGVRDTLREVRIALLEADVALPVVQTFISEVREKALGQEILKSLTPGFFPHRGNESLHHRQGNIGLQQRDAHLAQCRLDAIF